MNFEDRILEVVIPMEDVVEFRNGKKVTVAKKMFPGYLLVRCHLDDSTWAAIRDTPGIVNFVGAGGKPSRLSRREIDTFLPVIDETAPEAPKKTRARLGFDIGDTVRVKEGPFAAWPRDCARPSTRTCQHSNGGVGWFKLPERLQVPSWFCRRVCGGDRRF